MKKKKDRFQSHRYTPTARERCKGGDPATFPPGLGSQQLPTVQIPWMILESKALGIAEMILKSQKLLCIAVSQRRVKSIYLVWTQETWLWVFTLPRLSAWGPPINLTWQASVFSSLKWTENKTNLPAFRVLLQVWCTEVWKDLAGCRLQMRGGRFLFTVR